MTTFSADSLDYARAGIGGSERLKCGRETLDMTKSLHRKPGARQLAPWLCRTDARQVSDLPESRPFVLRVSELPWTDNSKEDISVSRRLTAHRSGRAIT